MFSIFIHCRLLAVILSSYCVPSELYLGFHLSLHTYKSIFLDKQSGRIVTDEIDHSLTKEPGSESLTVPYSSLLAKGGFSLQQLIMGMCCGFEMAKV